MTTYSGAELAEALAKGELSSAQHVIVGMLKESEAKDHVAFTVGDCESWTDLPTGLIDEAETIGRRGCRDHSHPVVRLRLKEPKSAEARAILSLLQGSGSGIAQPAGPPAESLYYADSPSGRPDSWLWARPVAATARMIGQGWDNGQCYKDCKDAGHLPRDCWNCCWLRAGNCAPKPGGNVLDNPLAPA